MSMSFIFMLFVAFLITYVLIWLAKPLALKVGLVDKPNHRKLHEGSVPLVGGLCVFLSILISVLIFMPFTVSSIIYVLLAGAMVAIGVLDDYKDISFKPRLIVQITIALVMVFSLDLKLSELGRLFGEETVEIGNFSIIFTVLAVVGCINAFNMVDGIDGLVGLLSLIAFSALCVLLYSGGHEWYKVCLLFCGSIIAYLMFNLNWPIRKYKKIFMGDAGSMLIGFTIIWLLCIGTQSGQSNFPPVAALWIVAIPLIDMAAIMIRRVRKGDSPFKPDREHLHHIFMRAGATPKQTLLIISLCSLLFSVFGIYLSSIDETLSLIVFIGVFIIYSYVIHHIWIVLKIFRKIKTKVLK